MALLAEELVEEWLRRKGYFTIRGVRLGVQEIDLLAIRPEQDGLNCRHVEVQASINPVNYLTPFTKSLQGTLGVRPTSQKQRTPDQVEACVAEWIERKFHHDRKVKLREQLVPGGEWLLELVVNRVKHEDEISHIEEHVKVHRLPSIVDDLREKGALVPSSAGADFVDLVLLDSAMRVDI